MDHLHHSLYNLIISQYDNITTDSSWLRRKLHIWWYKSNKGPKINQKLKTTNCLLRKHRRLDAIWDLLWYFKLINGHKRVNVQSYWNFKQVNIIKFCNHYCMFLIKKKKGLKSFKFRKLKMSRTKKTKICLNYFFSCLIIYSHH